MRASGALCSPATLFPGKPEPVAVRADSRGRPAGKWQEGFRLPGLARLRVPASLVVPAGIASRNRGVELWDGGVKAVAVTDILERGTDFDRVAIA
jgi:hypothetical protein